MVVVHVKLFVFGGRMGVVLVVGVLVGVGVVVVRMRTAAISMQFCIAVT